MFEITQDDVARLNDEDLRSLVGLLCESETRRRGFSALSVTWGGNQNASDGGIDVRVTLPRDASTEGFVPRPATGFQVKKSRFTRSDILEEMKPHGELRPAIRDLADRSGAYIIASSASTSDTALQERQAAMREAVEGLANSSDLALDFYDSGRLAAWVRDHAGLVVWVREKIGRSLRGWRPYGSWAYSPGGKTDQYLLDDELRIRSRGKSVNALKGIEEIRDQLRRSGSVIRLIGLSGLGKTRLVQALFDDRVGERSLEPSLAVYADAADDLDPNPATLISELTAQRNRAILVVDNCSPGDHRRLSELCRLPESRVSLVTIEYDIREDQPEGTEVFELAPSSTGLIEKLLKRRFLELSQVDAATIAHFSGGNTRIAIALAETVGRQETVAGMSDEDLFERLFEQRHAADEGLLLDAQALSLVYSFQGDDLSQNLDAELFRLASLAGKTADEIFRSVAELKNRGLIQQRGPWRAVLPHAIANRLAAMALRRTPPALIKSHLVNGAPTRLIRSFSRRLGYLDTSQEAQEIVREWLSPGGLLEEIAELNELGTTMLSYVAPVAPEAVLAAFERVLRGCNRETAQKCARQASVLHSIAWDPKLFDRSVELIRKIAEFQGEKDNSKDISEMFASLFMVCFSGTHATIDQRLKIIMSLLNSPNDTGRDLGLKALGAALETAHFGPGYRFEFGARSRDYGYWPGTKDEVTEWFRKILRAVEQFVCANEPLSSDIRDMLAQKFRGLWSHVAAYDDLEHICAIIAERCFWIEGWIAVRQTIHYDLKALSPEGSERLLRLEKVLKPRTLVQKVRSIVLPESIMFVGVDSMNETEGVEKTVLEVQTIAQQLGKKTASDPTVLAELQSELVTGASQQLWAFGTGLAIGANEPTVIWNQIAAELSRSVDNNKNPNLLRGFLSGLRQKNPELVNALLDEAVDHKHLAEWYPTLEAASAVDKKGVDRLIRSLKLGKAWIGTYRSLVSGGVSHQISGDDFNRLLLEIAAKPGGLNVSIELLYMRLSFPEGRSQSSDLQIIDIGCELIRRLTFTKEMGQALEYRFSVIAKMCLKGDRGTATIQEVCRNLKLAIAERETYPFYQSDFLQTLLSIQPLTVLESLCSEDGVGGPELGISILEQSGRFRAHPFDEIPEADLLAWCERIPEERYPAVAHGITAFRTSSDGGQEWTKIARKILDRAPNRRDVLKNFVGQLSPVLYQSRAADSIQANMPLLDDLAQLHDADLTEYIDELKARIAERLAINREDLFATHDYHTEQGFE